MNLHMNLHAECNSLLFQKDVLSNSSQSFGFHTKRKRIYPGDNVHEHISSAVDKIISSFESFQVGC